MNKTKNKGMKKGNLTKKAKKNLFRNLKQNFSATCLFRRFLTIGLIVAILSATLVLPDFFVSKTAAQSGNFGLCPDANGILQICNLQTRQAGIEMTEGAIDDVLVFYQLPQSERADVMKYARSEVRAMFYRRFVEIINKENRTPAEEEFVGWFSLYLQDLRERAAIIARDEYYDWQQNACNGWQPPAPFTYNPGTSCFRLQSYFSGPEPPTFEEFQQFGAAEVFRNLNTPEANEAGERTVQTLTIGIGAGSAVIGGVVGAQFGATISLNTLRFIFPYSAKVLANTLKIGLTAAGKSASGVIGAGAVGTVVTTVITTIITLVLQGIEVSRQSELPGKLDAAVAEAENVPNLRTQIANETGHSQFYGAFLLATMPEFADSTVPVPNPNDRQFVVRRTVPNGSPVITESPTINYYNWEAFENSEISTNPFGFISSARLSGNWFVETVNGVERKRLTIQILDGQSGRLTTVSRVGGKFLISDSTDPNRTKISDEFQYLTFVPNVGPAQMTAKIKAEQIEVSASSVTVNCLTNAPETGTDVIIGAVNGSTESPANLIVKVNGGTTATVNNITIRNLSITNDYKIKANILATNAAAPTVANFGVSVRNSSGEEKTDDFAVKLTAVVSDFVMNLPSEVNVGSNYSASLQTNTPDSCAIADYSVSGGELPPGTKLVTDAFGITKIEGILIAGGAYNFTITKTYTNGEKISKIYGIVVTSDVSDLTDNLKSWWRAEEDTKDFTGRANGTSVGNVSFADGMVNRAFRFDGSNAYVRLPEETFSPSLDFTFETWFKTASRGVILGRQRTANPYENPQFGATPAIYVDQNGRLRVQMFLDQNNQFITSANRVDDNRFHHVAVIYRRSTNTRTVYVDGISIGSTTAAQEAAPQKYQFGTGFVSDGTTDGMNGWFNFNGLIDDAALYDRVLTETEITQIVRAGRSGKLSVRVFTVPPSTRDGVNGAIQIVARGGTPGLEYSIDNGTTFENVGSFLNLAPGNYQLIVKDGAGNRVSRTATISNPLPGLNLSTILVPPTCSTTTNGRITILPSGLTGDAEFSVLGGANAQTSNVFATLGAETYTPWLRDISTNTFYTADPITLTAPAPFSVNPSNFTNAALNQPYSRTFTVTGGTPPFVVTASGTNPAVGNALPAGLTATADGSSITISGTPQETGTFQIRIGIYDQNTCFESRTFPLTITTNQTYGVSGKVTNGGQGLANVTVSYTDGNGVNGSTITNAAGNYFINSLAGDADLTLTPQLNGYVFTPETLIYDNLGANITDADFATAAATYEGDIASRPSGDGAVNVLDLVTLGRSLNGLDAFFADGAEYQRADIFPRSTLGDGIIDGNDLTQMRNYIVTNNPRTPAGGAVANVGDNIKSTAINTMSEAQLSNNLEKLPKFDRSALIDPATITAGTVGISGGVFVPITLNSNGNVSAVQFTIDYDSTKLSLVSVSPLAPNGTVITYRESILGQIMVVAHQPLNGASVFPAGNMPLLRLNFSVIPNSSGSAIIGFSDAPTIRLAADVQANAVTLNSVSGAVIISGPTSSNVSISGRVSTSSGRTIAKAIVVINHSDGTSTSVRTNAFGYYRFDNIPVGQTYVLQTSAKGFVFSPQIVTVQEDITEFDLIAQE